jgi:hypothetical protein
MTFDTGTVVDVVLEVGGDEDDVVDVVDVVSPDPT